jgi:hypothetical protein
MTDQAQSQRFPLKCDSLIQVFIVALVLKAGEELICKLI